MSFPGACKPAAPWCNEIHQSACRSWTEPRPAVPEAGEIRERRGEEVEGERKGGGRVKGDKVIIVQIF